MLDDGKRGRDAFARQLSATMEHLKERGMRKEDLQLAVGLTANMIASMGKGKYISMETLLRI